MQEISIKIPVKAHVKSYILAEYAGADRRAEAIRLDRRHECIIQNKLYDLLTRPSRYYRYDLGNRYDETLTIILPHWTRNLAGLHISKDKAIAFNNFVEICIRERLFILLDTLQDLPDIKIKPIIDSYIEHNNLSDSGHRGNGINYEALKKAYYRYRTRQASSGCRNNFRSWKVPVPGLRGAALRNVPEISLSIA